MSSTNGWTCTTPAGRMGRGWRAEFSIVGRVLPVLARREFQVRYQTSVLNVAWSVLQPLGVALIYAWLFAVVLDVPSEGLPYLSFAFAGIVSFRFFSFATSAALPCIHLQQGTISKVAVPVEAFPLAIVAGALVDLGVLIGILVVMAALQGITPGLPVLALIPVAAVLVAWTAAVCLFGAIVTVFVRDLNLALPLALQLLFVGSPIFYPSSALPERFEWLATVNPLAVVIEATRDVLLRGEPPSWALLAAQGVAGLLALVAATAYARSVGPRVVDVA